MWSRSLWKFHLKRFGAYLLLIVGIFVSIIGYVFDARQFVGKEGTGMDILRWLQHPPWYFFPLLLGLTFISLSWAWFQGMWSLMSDFEKEWQGLGKTRRDFEEKISCLYVEWSRDHSEPNALKDIVEKAEFPAGLPLKDENEKIRQYAAESMPVWEGARRTLADFCTAIYARQENSLLPNRNEWEEFDDMRMELSKFWDGWGAKCFNKNAMDEKKMLAKFPDQGEMILLLIYLEIARAYQHKSPGPGKQWLFRLGRMAA
jgi:hypothetical protein